MLLPMTPKTSLSSLDRGLILLFVTLIVAAGAGLRMWNIFTQPIWLDEAYSLYAATKDLDFLWNIVPRYETHPPFYYSLLHFWTLAFGDSTPAVRTLGLLCGLATLPVAALSAREIGRYLVLDENRTRLLTGTVLLLTAAAPFLIEMTRETRPYPVMMLVAAAEIGLLFRMARRSAENLPLASPAFAGHLVLLTLILWLHNLGILHGGAIGLAFLILVWRRDWFRADWAAFLLGHLMVAAAWAPAILILIDQAPTWIHSTWLGFGWKLVEVTMKALWAGQRDLAAAMAAILYLLAIATLPRLPRGGRALAALAVLAVAPVLIATLVSIFMAPVLMPRTMTPTILPALMLLGLGFTLSASRLRLVALAALLVLLGQMLQQDVLARQRDARAYWFGMVEWLAPRYQPGDQVYAYPNEAALPFRYAVRDLGHKMVTRPIPSDMPTLNPPPGSWNPTGSRGVFSLTEAELRKIADSPESRMVPTIWLLRSGPWAYDKGDHFLHALEAHRVVIARYRRGPIEMVGLRRADLAAREGLTPR